MRQKELIEMISGDWGFVLENNEKRRRLRRTDERIDTSVHRETSLQVD